MIIVDQIVNESNPRAEIMYLMATGSQRPPANKDTCENRRSDCGNALEEGEMAFALQMSGVCDAVKAGRDPDRGLSVSRWK